MRTAFALTLVVTAWTSGRAAQPSDRPVAPPDTRVLRDVHYTPQGDEHQVLDLYVPGAASRRPVPVVVLIHAGGYGGDGPVGDKTGRLTRWAMPHLLAAGYAVAAVNHRDPSQAIFPAQIQDVKAAVRWLRENSGEYHMDPQHVGAWGLSSGGHLAALLGTSSGVPDLDGDLGATQRALSPSGQTTRVQAVVDWFAPTDLLQFDAHRLPGGEIADEPGSAFVLLMGGSLHERPAAVRAANPITYVTPDDAPFLIFHGDHDLNVPHHQSELLRDALQQGGVEGQLRTVPGLGHDGPRLMTDAVAREVIAFLDVHLKAGR